MLNQAHAKTDSGGLLAVLFLWPTSPAKSPGILNKSNNAANFCSARLFIKGYGAISTANGTTTGDP